MKNDIQKSKVIAWMYRTIDIAASISMVIKAMTATNSYYIPIKYGAEPNLWIWFGMLIMSIAPVILMFGILKIFLRRELIRLEELGHIRFSETGLTEMAGDTTENLRSLDSNLSHLMKFVMSMMFVVVTFYFGVRLVLPEAFTGISWMYLLDVAMIVIPTVSLVLYKMSNQVGRLNTTY